MTLAAVSLADEYRHCVEDMGLTPEDLRKMLVFAAEAAFLPEEKKQKLVARVREALSKTKASGASRMLFCSLQIVDGILKILVEPPDVQPVDGFVVDLETDWEYEPAVLHLIIAPAYAGDAVIGVYMPLVGQRQHRQPRQARK